MCSCKDETAKLSSLAAYVAAWGNQEGSSAMKCIIAGIIFVHDCCHFGHPILYFSERSIYSISCAQYQCWHFIPPPCHNISHLCCVSTWKQGWSELGFPAIPMSTSFHWCNTTCCNRRTKGVFQFHLWYCYCCESGQFGLSAWLCVMVVLRAFKQFGCSLEDLWLGSPLLEYLVKGPGQDRVKHFLNHTEVFLTDPL